MSSDQLSNGILTSYPFYPVEGIVNLRDVGGYHSTIMPSRVVKKGMVFRSGETTRVTEKGKEALKELGVVRVFDLRSDTEIAKYQLPETKIDGIEFERVGVKEQVWYDPISLELRQVIRSRLA